jgi:hypothetical protein
MAAMLTADSDFSINYSFCFTLGGTSDFFLPFLGPISFNLNTKKKHNSKKTKFIENILYASQFTMKTKTKMAS